VSTRGSTKRPSRENAAEVLSERPRSFLEWGEGALTVGENMEETGASRGEMNGGTACEAVPVSSNLEGRLEAREVDVFSDMQAAGGTSGWHRQPPRDLSFVCTGSASTNVEFDPVTGVKQ